MQEREKKKMRVCKGEREHESVIKYNFLALAFLLRSTATFLQIETLAKDFFFFFFLI